MMPENQMDWFWARVVKSTAPDGCWEWAWGKHRGYGKFKIDGRQIIASRWIWEQMFGQLPAKINVCHKCDNPACVRPDHLFAGTNDDNVRDRNAKGRQAKGRRHGAWKHGRFENHRKAQSMR